MKKTLKFAILTLGAIIGILALLNPGPAAFKDYAKEVGNPNYQLYKRKANYIIFSIFTKHTPDLDKEYLGIAGNFFDITEGDAP